MLIFAPPALNDPSFADPAGVFEGDLDVAHLVVGGDQHIFACPGHAPAVRFSTEFNAARMEDTRVDVRPRADFCWKCVPIRIDAHAFYTPIDGCTSRKVAGADMPGFRVTF